MSVKRTAAEWNALPDREYTVIDPDGWDRKDWENSGWDTEQITFEEFETKAVRSTIRSRGLPTTISTPEPTQEDIDYVQELIARGAVEAKVK